MGSGQSGGRPLDPLPSTPSPLKNHFLCGLVSSVGAPSREFRYSSVCPSYLRHHHPMPPLKGRVLLGLWVLTLSCPEERPSPHCLPSAAPLRRGQPPGRRGLLGGWVPDPESQPPHPRGAGYHHQLDFRKMREAQRYEMNWKVLDRLFGSSDRSVKLPRHSWLKTSSLGTVLAIQWLRLPTPNAGRPGFNSQSGD